MINGIYEIEQIAGKQKHINGESLAELIWAFKLFNKYELIFKIL